jgi:glutathione peroxidase
MINTFLIAFLFFVQTSFYSLDFTDTSNTTHGMNAYQGRKILVVNIATGSPRVNQLGALQQLQELYGDSLTVIAFPSNSFGNESRTDSAIHQYCFNNYGASYLIARKADVKGLLVQPVYNWITSHELNGSMDGNVSGDFQKFLISGSGELIGVFAPNVSPMDSLIRNAIVNN